MADLLSEPAIIEQLAQTQGWTREGVEILRKFTFKNFAEALRFVNAVGETAERANHHPDIDIRWNKVTLRLSTHSKGGLTESDFLLAREVNGLI